MHPILFEAGPFRVYAYGALIALALALSFALAASGAARRGLPAATALDLLVVVFLSGIFGARLWYVLQHASDFRGREWEAFYLHEGGLVWYGGFAAAFAGGYFFARRRRLPVWRWADTLAPIIALAHALGRAGCFLNGCCYGSRGGGLFAAHFPGHEFGRHPVQLYESALLLVLCVWLYKKLSQTAHDGAVFLLYVSGYALIRFALEFLRDDQVRAGGLTWPQWVSLALLGACFFLRRRAGRNEKIG